MFQHKTMDLAPAVFFCEYPVSVDGEKASQKASSSPGVLPAKTVNRVIAGGESPF